MNIIWNFISGIGVKSTDEPNRKRSKEIFNRSLIILFVSFLLADTLLYVFAPNEDLRLVFKYRGIFFSIFYLLLYVINSLGQFKVSRVLLMGLFLPLFFMPNIISGIRPLYPYVWWNGIVSILLPFVIIIYLFDRAHWRSASLFYGLLVLVSFFDFLILPALGLADPISGYRYMVFKGISIMNVLSLVFLANVLKGIIAGLLDLNEDTLNSFEDKKNYLQQLEKQVNEKIDTLNGLNKP